MADRRSKHPDPSPSRPLPKGGQDREARLAEALRQNLRRRKAQRVGRSANPESDTGADADGENG
jgi:hypothetical protein